MAAYPTAPEGPLLRALASSSTARRRAAMLQIETYLSSGRRFTELDLQKLWKALFYCLYMTPKMRNQQHLAVQIAELALVFRRDRGMEAEAQPGDGGEDEGEGEAKRVQDEAGQDGARSRKRKRKADTAEAQIGARKALRRGEGRSNESGIRTDDGRENFVLFLRTFWDTMIREWEGVDKVRLDKFLFLVRRVILVGFEGCKVAASGHDAQADDEKGDKGTYAWDEELVRQCVAVLAEGPLQPRSQKIPGGLRLHVLDVLVDELDRADADRLLAGDEVMAPIRRLSEQSQTKSVRKRAKEALADERLQEWGVAAANDGRVPSQSTAAEDDEGDGDWQGFGD